MTEALGTVLGSDLAAASAAALLRANLAMSAAIVVVAVLRTPMRQAHGPAVAYLLWWGPLAAAMLTPLAGLLSGAPDPMMVAFTRKPDLLHGFLIAWAAGSAMLAGGFAFAQARFHARLRAGQAGPAVVGFFAPQIVFPSDTGLYSDPERELIRAHEREHVARKDPRAVAVTTLLQCLCWFNPLVHLAAGLLRLDQELACDAAVILRRPGARGLYARTLLKSQMMTRPPPLACCWLALGGHPLELRIENLKRRSPASSHSAVHATADAIRP
jgi:beta-lactamase regulating signal transducer with metallopeptidase domain